MDVINFLLRENGTQVDLGRMGALIPLLNSYKFDTYINTPVVPFDFLRSKILPLLPVVERQGQDGLYYDIVKWTANPIEAIYTVNADNRTVSRSAPLVKRVQGELYNEFTIEFGQFAKTGRYTRRTTITAQAGFLSGANPLSNILGNSVPNVRIFANLFCSLSQSRFGVKPAPPIKAGAIWDDVTALRVLRDRAERDALPKRVTQYTGGPHLEWLAGAEGSIVLVQDTPAGLNGVVARIDNVAVGAADGRVVIDVTILDDPTQYERLTA